MKMLMRLFLVVHNSHEHWLTEVNRFEFEPKMTFTNFTLVRATAYENEIRFFIHKNDIYGLNR